MHRTAIAARCVIHRRRLRLGQRDKLFGVFHRQRGVGHHHKGHPRRQPDRGKTGERVIRHVRVEQRHAVDHRITKATQRVTVGRAAGNLLTAEHAGRPRNVFNVDLLPHVLAHFLRDDAHDYIRRARRGQRYHHQNALVWISLRAGLRGGAQGQGSDTVFNCYEFHFFSQTFDGCLTKNRALVCRINTPAPANIV